MPASSIDLYHMQDAKNNFVAMRPAPVCTETNMFMGQCPNIHISTNCYYGFHDPKSVENTHGNADCEMMEVPHAQEDKATNPPQANARKRSAEDSTYPQNKRLREGKISINYCINLIEISIEFTNLFALVSEYSLVGYAFSMRFTPTVPI